jgi:UDP:flavonoid glycosyltransferase YjiC (YdhE family)
MRVLVTTLSGLGHVHPMVPLARAVQSRGHEVRWATGEDVHGVVKAAGLAPVTAGRAVTDRLPEFARRYPEVLALPPEEIPDVMFAKVFGAIEAPATLADLLPLARAWKPDLVIHDVAEFAGPIIAAVAGVPNVAKSFGALIPRHKVALAGEEVAPLWRSVGLQPRAFGGCYDHLYLDIYPPGLQPESAPHVPNRQLIRPVAYDTADGADAAPALPTARADAPLVYLTMGTAFFDLTVTRAVLAALAELDVRTLVTVGPDRDPAELGAQPAWVRVERYVPHTVLLGHCDVVVSHAGSGTVLAALALGLPQLCLPQGADQFGNAAHVVATGAGLALAPAEATAGAIADAVLRLLRDTSLRPGGDALATGHRRHARTAHCGRRARAAHTGSVTRCPAAS